MGPGAAYLQGLSQGLAEGFEGGKAKLGDNSRVLGADDEDPALGVLE